MPVAAKRTDEPAKRPTNITLICAFINLCLVCQLIKSTAILSNVDSPTYDELILQHSILGENLKASERQTENARKWYEESLIRNAKLEESLKAHELQLEKLRDADSAKRDLKQKLASVTKELESSKKETIAAKQELLRSSAKDESTGMTRQKKRRKKKKKLGKMDCEGFPEWPLSQENTLYNDQVGSPLGGRMAERHPCTMESVSMHPSPWFLAK